MLLSVRSANTERTPEQQLQALVRSGLRGSEGSGVSATPGTQGLVGHSAEELGMSRFGGRPVTKAQVLHDPTYTRPLEQTGQRQGDRGAGGWGRGAGSSHVMGTVWEDEDGLERTVGTLARMCFTPLSCTLRNGGLNTRLLSLSLSLSLS